MKNIKTIGKKIGLNKELELYGNYMAKIDFTKLTSKKKGKLVLVTATSPTPFGEGKTTISLGLLDSLNKLGINAIASLREPSLGPVFGMKGGATGGGKATVEPSTEINLHFTGDFHAITSANNLLCAAIDNHIHQGNELQIDPDRIMFNRCLDVNDRGLKDITIHGKNYERKEAFSITAASEIMAIICLAKDYDDLRKKLDNILIAYDLQGKPIFAKSLTVTGSMLALLKNALKPNLVQTAYGNPVIVHGGPFANIAHGCSSYLATSSALKLGDYCVTEAGFGSDLGALKFFDIKCRKNNLQPVVTVLVTTIRALKYNGNNNLEEGLSNLQAHIDILKNFTEKIIVCLNKFGEDKDEEIELVKEYVNKQDIPFTISTSYLDGEKGSIDLAKKVLEYDDISYNEIYNIEDKLEDKINRIVKDIYKAGKIEYSDKALETIKLIKDNKLDNLPVCIAKTQYSISDNKDVLGYPKDYAVTIKNVKLYNGAGFITVYLGNIITMPGLNKEPNYKNIDLIDNEIIGVK